MRLLRLGRASFPKRGEGSRTTSKYFTLVFGPSKKGGCAVVAGRSIAKNAVERNRLRRRIMHVAGPWLSKERYVLIYPKKDAATLSYRLLSEELSGLLKKALR